MSKFGLQLRVKPQQKKQPTRPPLPTPLGFDDDDDDNVERDILRQAYKNKTHKDVEELHKKTLEEDPSAFDYDGVYDQMKEKQSRPKEMDRQDRKPRYIQGLIDKAKKREREHDIIYERKLAKERNQDEHLYSDKDKFVTSAYKKKLAEQAKWMEEERLRELREEKEDVTKKTDITDFYFNLAKNVAFGAGDADKEKPRKQREEAVVQPPRQVSPTATSTSSLSSRAGKNHQNEIEEDSSLKEKSKLPQIKPVSDITAQHQVTTEPSASNQVSLENQKENEDAAKARHKRSEDAVAAARERFLARKKAKV